METENPFLDKVKSAIAATCPKAAKDFNLGDVVHKGSTVNEIRRYTNEFFRGYLIRNCDNLDVRIMLSDYDNHEYWWQQFTTKVLPWVGDK